MSNSSPFSTMKGSFLELFVILSMTGVLFYLVETNMLVFGLFVYAGLFWIVRGVPNVKLSLVTGFAGGLAGFLTEYWGCASHFWNWVTPCTSLWMINGMEDGFPVEVVVAYAGAGFWMSKLSLKMFPAQHGEAVSYFAEKKYLEGFYLRFAIAVLIDVVGVTVICVEPMFLQSVTMFMLGLNVLVFLPRGGLMVSSLFALVVGVVGFFFENFATGFFSSFAVWRYDLELHTNTAIPIPIVGVAPITAFIAYLGVGSLLFGLSFLLNYALSARKKTS